MTEPSFYFAGPHFNGPDYVPELDHARLTKQIDRIRELMKDGVWRALFEIEEATHDPQASISAQLRHLRKRRFGSWTVNRRRRDDTLWEYQLLPPSDEPVAEDVVEQVVSYA